MENKIKGLDKLESIRDQLPETAIQRKLKPEERASKALLSLWEACAQAHRNALPKNVYEATKEATAALGAAGVTLRKKEVR